MSIITTDSIARSKKQAFEKANVNSLLSIQADAKTIKGTKKGYLTGILYLAPHNTVTSAKIKTVCPSAIAAGCSAACLYSAGRGRFNNVQEGRIKRTQSFLDNQTAFMIALWYDVKALAVKARKEGLIPCVRLNGTSDIVWHLIRFVSPNGTYGSIQDHFPEIQFYGYTKNTHLKLRDLPANDTLVYSYSAFNDKYAEKAYKAAIHNSAGLAVVFRGALPETYLGLPVINADETDLRFLDKEYFDIPIDSAYIVGLKAKGEAKKDTSGFVV